MNKTLYLALSFLSLVAIAGCGENSTSVPSNSSAGTVSQPDMPRTTAARGTPAVSQEAQYTIRCHTYSIPNHALLARRLKDELSAMMAGNFYVIQGELSSTVYYGFYASDDHTTPSGRKAQDDLMRLKSLKDGDGQTILDQLVLVVPVETPDTADANPQWNLNSYPRTEDHRYYFSVQIAAFKGNSLRKEAAVQMVKDLREHNVEAYYYHGQEISTVSIGIWPITALKKQDSDHAVAANADPDSIQIAATGLPPNLASMTDREGHVLHPMVQRIEIEDPSMIATMRKFNTHAINYEVNRHTVPQPDGSMRVVEDPSFLVILPHEADEPLDAPTQAALPSLNTGPQPDPGPAQPSIPTVPTAGSGRLKSLGE